MTPELLMSLVILLALVALILLIKLVRRKPETLVAQFRKNFEQLEHRQDRLDNTVRDEITRNRNETTLNAKQAREELSTAIRRFSDSLLNRMSENAGMQKNQLDSFSKQLLAMTQLNEEKLETMRKSIETQLHHIQNDNSKKLEQMRAVVDEKLQTTLEKRLSESFKQVSERLEQVYKGLGEMRNLATGVGDLKKVLTNVKTRGTWGEIRLSHILEQILAPDPIRRKRCYQKEQQ